MEHMGRSMDISFDIDLGEIVKGHHVIARGIELAGPLKLHRYQQEFEAERDKGVPSYDRPVVAYRKLSAEDMEVVGTRLSEPQLHYEFVPGLGKEEDDEDHFFWYWMLHVSDDVGTQYGDDNGGTRGPAEGGAATHATRDIGRNIPDSATRLVIEFEPPPGSRSEE